jgi:hypothetical protein
MSILCTKLFKETVLSYMITFIVAMQAQKLMQPGKRWVQTVGCLPQLILNLKINSECFTASDVVIPEATAESYGLLAGMVKRKKENGGGFPVYIDTLHLLHCLVRLLS